MEDWQHGGFGLYLHWPFCQSKCPYCDFNSHVAASIDQTRWQAAYLAEIDRLGAETQGRVLNSVFFGGGTPSLMNPDLVAALIDKIRSTWPMSNDPEITLEANPGSIEAGRFRGYREGGVNRISMGMQAMNDATLVTGMIESVTAVANADDIAAVDGLDMLLIGTNDLCNSLGVPGQLDHPQVREAYAHVAAACRRYGKRLGVGGLNSRPELAKEMIALGASYVSAGSDTGFLMSAATATAKTFR